MSSHDVGEGGILIAVAEMCITGNLGLTIDEDKEFSHRFYFGENQSRYLIEIKKENFEQIKQLAKNKNISFEKLGEVNQENIRINKSNIIKVSELKRNYEQGISEI